MAYNLKEVVADKKSRFTAGHRMCAGCGAPVVGRMVLRALKNEDHAVIFIHIQLGQIHLYIPHLNVQEQPYQEQKLHINH